MEEVIQRLQKDATDEQGKDEQASDLTQDNEAEEDSKPGVPSHDLVLLTEIRSKLE